MNIVLKFEEIKQWYGTVRELVVPRLMIMWCYSPVKPTAMKGTTKSPLLDLISGLWTKCIHLVSKNFRKIYLIASNGRDGNCNSEDYITNFWRGSEGVVKTGLHQTAHHFEDENMNENPPAAHSKAHLPPPPPQWPPMYQPTAGPSYHPQASDHHYHPYPSHHPKSPSQLAILSTS